MTHRKKLIEVALPLEAINEASAREKSIRHGHPSTLHLWWARRPLAAARAVIFASLVDDPDDPNALPAFIEACKKLPKGKNVDTNGDTPRMRLFDFIERLVTWEATTDDTILGTARNLIQIATEGNPPPLLDPFAGGGSIPLEAQRLGLEAHASDLNPVAVMINKAQIEIPPRFANMPPVNPRDRARMNSDEGWKGTAGLAADVRYYGEWMRDKAWERIGHLYPTHNDETVIAWLWARTVKCPNPACGAQMPLVSSFEISKKRGKNAYIKPNIDRNQKSIRFEVFEYKGIAPASPKVGRGATFQCIVCEEVATDDYIKQMGINGQIDGQMIAIITEGANGRNHHTPTSHQENIARSADPTWYPTGRLADDPRNIWCKAYGITDIQHLTTSRQLLALNTFSDLAREAEVKIKEDIQFLEYNTKVKDYENYAPILILYLTMLVNQLVNHQSSLCGWNAVNSQMRSLFSRQALPMVWDFAESNPFCESSGSYHNLFERFIKGFIALPSYQNGYGYQHDATQQYTDIFPSPIISTDPPYYDNISYSDLADVFYVWLRKNLRDKYPDIFDTILPPKNTELIASAYRFHGNRQKSEMHFEKGLSKSFVNMRQIVNTQYPLTVYYAFKQAELAFQASDTNSFISSTGWETMLAGLLDSGFSILGTWPVRTEKPGRTIGIGTNALASSIVLVCRPRPEDAPTTSRRAFLDDLRRELPAALREMQSGNIAPVDLAQASIGPGMAIYSRYRKVLEADGTPMSIRTALGLINAALDEYLAEQDGEIDPDTRFAVDWFTQFGFNEGDFGQADVLARAKNTSVAGIEASGLVVSGRGKVRLIHWSEHDATNTPDTGDPSGRSTKSVWNPQEDKRPTVWEATHHLIGRLNNHGETGSAMLLNTMPPDMAAEARQLAYRLYSICERKGWADHAREYNALVVSWSGIGEVAAQQREAAARGDATTQMGMFDDHT